jgi:Raf kinase inhibitor-like YbhB/YbcL family protein
MFRKGVLFLLLASLGTALVLVSACGTAQYELSASIEPAGAGSVSPSGGNYDDGASVTLTATPSEGYVFERWSGDVSVTSESFSITMDADKEVTAHFSKKQAVEPAINNFTVTFSVEPAGSGSVWPSSGSFEEGESVNFTASPNVGYIFDRWRGDASGTVQSITVTVDGDKNIVVHFSAEPEEEPEPVRFTLTTSVKPEGSGSIAPSQRSYQEGFKVTLTATPDEGYVFEGWSGDATGTTETVTFTMDADKEITAHFMPIPDFILRCAAFIDGGDIPVEYTCEGDDISPRLTWSGVPTGTQTLVLIMEDPDAPFGLFTHWVVYNIPPDVFELEKNLPNEQELSNGAQQGINNFATFGYGGPCPPQGARHEYRFILYAVDTTLNVDPYGATRQAILNAIQDHILDQAQISGYFR